MPAFEDLTGKRYGRLTVIEKAQNESCRKTKWLCRCDCGRLHIVLADHLKDRSTTSCGCLKKELFAARASEMAKGNRNKRTHNKTKSRLYRIWNSMKQRCTNPNRNRYENYGGRGIRVCEEWAKDFSVFQKWALAHGYKDDLTIDHKDNDKGYSPDNCKWATMKEQQNNRRNNRRQH